MKKNKFKKSREFLTRLSCSYMVRGIITSIYDQNSGRTIQEIP